MSKKLNEFLIYSNLLTLRNKYTDDFYWKNLMKLWSELSKDDIQTNEFKNWFSETMNFIDTENKRLFQIKQIERLKRKQENNNL